jgi:cytosine/creatinine deaminase
VRGWLPEGIAVWADRVAGLTVDDVQPRVRQVLRWQLANGVQTVRCHVDVCDPRLTALRDGGGGHLPPLTRLPRRARLGE